jgi:hypothetical protein
MQKKKVTKAVVNANRANAKKSTGPKTPAGKQRARLGALTHGFFAKELPLSDEEKRRLEETRRQLQSQLLPTTVFQHITFAEIIACIWPTYVRVETGNALHQSDIRPGQ